MEEQGLGAPRWSAYYLKFSVPVVVIVVETTIAPGILGLIPRDANWKYSGRGT